MFNASYRSNADVDVYAEISHVPDVPVTSPNCEPLFVSRSPQYEHSAANEETNKSLSASAVDLGDKYIEFKMNPGSTDSMVGFIGSHPNYRPEPPTRPVPYLVINSNLPTAHVDQPKASNAAKPPVARIVSSSQLSPDAGPSYMYDYAVGSDLPKLGANFSPSLHLTEPDSENNLKAPVLYDYAHVSDSEIEAKLNESTDSVYWDVDGSEYDNTTLEPGLVAPESGVYLTAI